MIKWKPRKDLTVGTVPKSNLQKIIKVETTYIQIYDLNFIKKYIRFILKISCIMRSVEKINPLPYPPFHFIYWMAISIHEKKNIQCYTREITHVKIIVFHDTDLFNKLLVCVKNYSWFENEVLLIILIIPSPKPLNHTMVNKVGMVIGLTLFNFTVWQLQNSFAMN